MGGLQKVAEKHIKAVRLSTEWVGFGPSFRNKDMAYQPQVDAFLSPVSLGVQDSRIVNSAMLICWPD
jgi:hypothetical protein